MKRDCTYWVSAGSARYRSGDLRAFEEELSSDLFLGEWSSRKLTRQWGPPQGLLHATYIAFGASEDSVILATGSFGKDLTDAPPEIRKMGGAAQSWTKRLWGAGHDVDGPLRLVVIDRDLSLPGISRAKWPLSWPLASIAMPEDSVAFPSTLVDDEEDLALLRPLWDDFLSGAYGEGVMDPPFPFSDDVHSGDAGVSGTKFSVLIRDALPFEDADGIVR